MQGLISYRKALADAGVVDGFQWLDGSFVEDVESSRQRPPADIDLVTFSASPSFTDLPTRRSWFQTHIALFDRDQTKEHFKCDAFFIDLGKRPDLLVDDSRYWFGLFSHQRETSLWKGMLQVPMLPNDEAKDFLDAIKFSPLEVVNA